MYAIVPAINGVPQVGTRYLHEGKSISETQAIAYFEGGIESEWTELTEEQYKTYWTEPPE